MDESGERGEFVGEALRELAIEVEDFAGGSKRMRGDPAEDHVDRVRSVLERSDDAEVATPTLVRPEQVRVVGVAGGDDPPVGEDDLGRLEVVDGHAVLAHEPTQTAAERQSGDPRRGDHAAGGRQSVDVGRAVVFVPGHAGLRAHPPRRRIDMDAAHRREIDHEPALGCREPCDVVASAADRHLDASLAAEVDGVANVSGVRATRHEPWVLVDQAVVDAPGGVVPGGVGSEELSVE